MLKLPSLMRITMRCSFHLLKKDQLNFLILNELLLMLLTLTETQALISEGKSH